MNDHLVSLASSIGGPNNEASLSVASFSARIASLTGKKPASIQMLIDTLPLYYPQRALPDQPELENAFDETLHILGEFGRLGSALKNDDNYQLIKRLYVSFLANPTVKHLLDELKSWNSYSYYHSLDVFILGTLLAKKRQFPELDEFALACLLHDVGKRLVPEEILTKKSKLTQAEFQLVQHHAQFGADLLKLLGFSEFAYKIAQSHHERLDGSGYPHGIGQSEFSEALRLISVIDVFSALTLQRSYREPLQSFRALEILLSDHAKLCQKCVYALADVLQLFPPDSELLLANGLQGTFVQKSGQSSDDLELVVQESTQSSNFSIQDVSPIKMVGWKSHRLEHWQKELWTLFIESLNKDNDMAAHYFDELTDGKRVEAIYHDVFGKVGKETREAYLGGRITEAEGNATLSSCLRIMNKKLVEYAPSYRVSIKQGVVLVPVQPNHIFPLRLLHDTLFVNGWRTYFLKSEHQVISEIMARLLPILEKDFVNTVALSITESTDVTLLNTLLKKIHASKPNTKLILYYRQSSLLKEIDLKLVDFYSTDLHQFLNHLNNY